MVMFASPKVRLALLGGLVTLLSCSGGDSKDSTPTAPRVLMAVSVVLSPATIQVGQSVLATASGLDQNNAPIATGAVTWSSSSQTVATIAAGGSITAVAVGQTTITAAAAGKSGTAILTVTPIPVASVAVAPASPSVIVGTTQQLTATALDASGAMLTGRAISWTSSDSGKAKVSATGVVTGVAVGSATVTASSEGKTGIAAVTVVAIPANVIRTGIRDANTFVTRCATSDPAYTAIRQDFQFLSEGTPSTTVVTCTEPYTSMPAAQRTDELLATQTLLLAYYMSQGTAGRLPWTTLPLYEWLKSQIAGIDFRVNYPNSACCVTINGKKFMILARKDATSLGWYNDWVGMSAWMALFAHEARHADGPGHVNGCPSWPLPTDPRGCDATYDLTNLGSYGVQYWLYAGWVTGYLNVGLACAPAAKLQAFAASQIATLNLYPRAMVTNAPPTFPETTPYGGVCFAP